MILGYEQPVDIPVMSIYDKDMMKMYLGALREDYKEGVQEMKDYNKMVSDFYSPSRKDNENWYNMTKKPIVDYLNANPDAIRSVEGRSWIRNFINSRPYKDMADIRQTAEVGRQFQKALAEMKAKGLFNPEMESMINPVGLEDWDTLQNGVWTKPSPTAFQTLNQFTSSMFDNLKDTDLGVSPIDKRYRRKGVTEDQMRPIVNYKMDDLLSSDLGRYYYAKAKEELQAEGNADPADSQIRKRFADNIITANKERIHVIDEADEFAKIDAQGKYRALGRGRGGSRGGNSGGTFNYVYDNTNNVIKSVHGDNADNIMKGLKNGDATQLKLSQAKILKQYENIGNAYHQSLHLAGKETNAGFYARFGMKSTGNMSTSQGVSANGNRSGVNASGQINPGIDVNGDADLVRSLRTLRDISTNAYGSRKIKVPQFKRTSGGNSLSLAQLIVNNGYKWTDKMADVVKKITPVSGDKNIIHQINNDGTLHAYRKVKVLLKKGDESGKVLNDVWLDYGQTDWNDEQAIMATRMFEKEMGVNGKPFNLIVRDNGDWNDNNEWDW